MATKKKLIHFKKGENYDIQKANGNILDSSICFIQDRKTIVTHGTEYKTVNWGKITPPPLEDGVYVLTADRSLIHYSMADETALGVVVVYGEHKFMIAKEDASEKISLVTSVDIPLTGYDKVNPYGQSQGLNYSYYFSYINEFTGPLSDYDGKYNTDIILNHLSINALSNFNREQQIFKDWYIPALGQLGILYLLRKEIFPAILKIGGKDIVVYSDEYLSSTKHKEKKNNMCYFWRMNFPTYTSQGQDGKVLITTETSSFPVRFFRNFEINDYSSVIYGTANVISFTINNSSYQAYEGMTWREWCASSLNNGNFEVMGDSSFIMNGAGILVKGATSNDIITNNSNYELNIDSSGYL